MNGLADIDAVLDAADHAGCCVGDRATQANPVNYAQARNGAVRAFGCDRAAVRDRATKRGGASRNQ